MITYKYCDGRKEIAFPHLLHSHHYNAPKEREKTTMTEIVSIGKAIPVADVVGRLTELLKRAESGELRSIMWIAELRDGSRVTGFSACEDMQKLLADAARLTHRIQRRMDEETSTIPLP